MFGAASDFQQSADQTNESYFAPDMGERERERAWWRGEIGGLRFVAAGRAGGDAGQGNGCDTAGKPKLSGGREKARLGSHTSLFIYTMFEGAWGGTHEDMPRARTLTTVRPCMKKTENMRPRARSEKKKQESYFYFHPFVPFWHGQGKKKACMSKCVCFGRAEGETSKKSARSCSCHNEVSFGSNQNMSRPFRRRPRETTNAAGGARWISIL